MNTSDRVYPINSHHNCIDDYVYPKDVDEWKECPNCGLKPKIWVFDNGKSTACGCWESKYDHFSIRAESILSYINRNRGSAIGYNFDELKENWNHWVETGQIKFSARMNRW